MVGKALSHYKILEELGRGGMGIVYKADDTKLDRTVAIKVLPPAALANEDDRARFYREAKAAAQLHHPNIASIFEIDEAVPEGSTPDDLRPFIAMEYIEGMTLDAKVKDAPLKLEDAVRIGGEIASALEAAHEKDIVHRDIKSQNVMLTDKGVAKVLDFGLAQTAQSTKLTRMGSTLGTIAYMSPEQARSEEVDSRTDIWSLGVVLYEMISGRLAFPGDYEQAAVYSILNEDPEPLTSLRTGVPMALEWIVGKCLAKKADDRYQSAKELLVDLKNVDLAANGMSRITSTSRTPLAGESVDSHSTTVQPSLSSQLLRPLQLILAVVFLLTGFFVARALYPSQVAEPVVRHITMAIPGIKRIEDPAITPRGDRVAFQGIDSTGRAGLYEYELVPGGKLIYYDETEFAYEPEYSPDGRWIVYSGQPFNRPIQKHRVGGGPQPITGSIGGTSPAWVDSETIAFTDTLGYLRKISASGGEATLLAQPDSLRDHTDFIIQNISADKKWASLCIRQTGANSRPLLGIMDLSSGSYKAIESSACYASFVGTEFLVYSKVTSRQSRAPGTIVVRQLSPDNSVLVGPAHDLFRELPGYAIAVGEDGTLLHSPVVSNIQEAILTRQDLFGGGDAEELGTVPWNLQMSISPDGNKIAMMSASTGLQSSDQIAVWDLNVGTRSPIVTGESIGSVGWSFDNQYLVFTQLVAGERTIQKKKSDGSGLQTTILGDGAGFPVYSSDGKYLAYSGFSAQTIEHDKGVYVLDEQSGETVVLDSTSLETEGKSFSEAGDYIVYQRKSSNDLTELVVKSIHEENEWLLGEGLNPTWDSEKGFIYFENDLGTRIFRIPVAIDPVFRTVGPHEEVLHSPFGSKFTLDIVNDVAYTNSFMSAELDAPDAVLNLTLHFDQHVRELLTTDE